jgi:Lon protease-like protein
MTSLAMFPLGSVLFPHMPVALRVFEDRYLVMLSRVLQVEPSEFGVVLIERGQEVGGGEKRFSIGTVATIVQLEAEEGVIGLIAQGGRRVSITKWLDEDPYPQAEVTELPQLDWDDDLAELLVRAEDVVRRALALASEFTDSAWSPDIELSDDPIESAWQLAAIAPLGPIDQITLLRSGSVRELLDGVISLTLAAAETFTLAWTDDDSPDTDTDTDTDSGDDDRL